MLPRRRFLAPWSAAVFLGLAACSATTDGDDTARGTDDSFSTGSVSCDEAPPVPSDAPSFTPVDLPAPTTSAAMTATIETNCGDITIEMEASAAPQTVASFDFLATQGYWADSPCHRLASGSIHVLQCGDPTGTGRGGPGYTFGLENAPDNDTYPRGTVAMARTSDPDTNGGQFFFVTRESTINGDTGGYTIFGKVTGGMDVVDYVANEGIDGGGGDGVPSQPISILNVTVEEEASET
ncbi:peptidylprolyl isomerase [Ornithinimicrobium sp. Arc0846-15]|nr:peptidylprolyl isomerase [Ornithinimicrobium laminariae]